MTIRDTIHDAIKRHAGLSDWDDDAIAEEVTAILNALNRAGFQILEKGSPTPSFQTGVNTNDT